MSDRSTTNGRPAMSPTPRPPARGPFGGGPWGGGGMPAEKPMRFWPSVRRLINRLSPQRLKVLAVIGLGVTSVAFMVIGPKIIGRATDIIFSGVIGKRLPPGITVEQAIAGLRAAGHKKPADLIAKMNVIPGQGIDFGALASVLLLAIGLYLASSAFSWMQGYLLNGVVQ